MTARSILTPLQLTAASVLLDNQGIAPLPAALTSALLAFNSTALISAYTSAVSAYLASSFKTDSTLEQLLSLGAGVCPALGNSIPAAPLGSFSSLVYFTQSTGGVAVQNLPVSPYGFSGLVEQLGNAYLGSGDAGRFAQGFLTAQGYISVTNDFINSAVNVNSYLGPTFVNQDLLITANVAAVNSDLVNFGVDLQRQGQLWDLGNIELYGTPAGLMQQLAKQAKTQPSTIPSLRQAMLAQGATDQLIRDLVTDNRQSLFNPDGLTENQFDRAQKLAYQAMTQIVGADLDTVLSILDVTTPNIATMADLLDPVKTFPLSYRTLQTPTPAGPVLIFGPDSSVNSAITPVVNSYLPTATGCDELGKIIPPANATANKAIQVALQQISGITETELPLLAQAVRASVNRPWDPTQPYLANDVVSDSAIVPNYYRAQQAVPPGVNLSDSAYWAPAELPAMSLLTGLPLVQNLTTPAPASAVNFFANTIALGSGPSGTITTCDMLGTAIDSHGFAAQFAQCTEVIDDLQTAGALTALLAAYSAIQGAANDATVITQISAANSAIAAVAASYPAETALLNQAFLSIATPMNLEQLLQTRAGLNYNEMVNGEQVSVMALIQNLPEYARDTGACSASEFLESVCETGSVDPTVATGAQALVGAMRESRNIAAAQQARLFAANQIPTDPLINS